MTNNNIINHSNISGYPPVLSREDEYDLAVDLYENHNLEAAKSLVLSQMRFVSYIAGEYKGYGLEHNDLVQEGTIGLMKSVKKFNPYKKVRLSTFAVYWIRAEIHEFIFKNWKIVKLATTKAQRKLFFKLNKAKANIEGQLSEEQVLAIADNLHVSPKDVMEMEHRLTFSPILIDDEDSRGFELGVENSDNDGGMMEIRVACEHNQIMMDSLGVLTDIELNIIKSRFLNDSKTNLSDLAKTYEVSIETIRNWEKKAMGKLKTEMMQSGIVL